MCLIVGLKQCDTCQTMDTPAPTPCLFEGMIIVYNSIIAGSLAWLCLQERLPGSLVIASCLPGHCKDDVIQYLVESWLQAVQIAIHVGRLPLYYACQGKSFLTVIQALVYAWPNTVHVQDENGCLLLHYSLKHGPSHAAS